MPQEEFKGPGVASSRRRTVQYNFCSLPIMAQLEIAMKLCLVEGEDYGRTVLGGQWMDRAEERGLLDDVQKLVDQRPVRITAALYHEINSLLVDGMGRCECTEEAKEKKKPDCYDCRARSIFNALNK